MSKPMEQIEEGTPEFRVISMSRIVESELNPRRHYNPDRIKDLAESITSVGVIEPLVVRHKGQPEGAMEAHFEIVSGSRRFRAAKLAGTTDEIPILIRELTDQQALEIMVIENNQREDVNAMEEADGYEKLMTGGYGLDRLAERIGRSTKYIYDRIKLLQLVPEAKKLVLDGRVSAGHAILLARLKPEEQKRAMAEDWGGLWEHEQLLWDPADNNPLEYLKTRSVRELQAWIDEHVRFDRNVQVNQDLFPETQSVVQDAKEKRLKVIQITHEYVVKPDAKEGNTERIYSERSWRLADGSKGSKPCDKSVTGIIVVGPDRGSAHTVCIHKDCAVHKGKERQAAEKAYRRSGTKTNWEKEGERRQAEYKQEAELTEKRRAEWKSAETKILDACVAKVKTSKPGILAEVIYRVFNMDALKRGRSVLGKKWKTTKDLLQLFAMAVLIAEYDEYAAYERFPAWAKRIGVDVKAILAGLQKERSKSEVHTSAKKAKKAV